MWREKPNTHTPEPNSAIREPPSNHSHRITALASPGENRAHLSRLGRLGLVTCVEPRLAMSCAGFSPLKPNASNAAWPEGKGDFKKCAIFAHPVVRDPNPSLNPFTQPALTEAHIANRLRPWRQLASPKRAPIKLMPRPPSSPLRSQMHLIVSQCTCLPQHTRLRADG
jgi:hypothetical protein